MRMVRIYMAPAAAGEPRRVAFRLSLNRQREPGACRKLRHNVTRCVTSWYHVGNNTAAIQRVSAVTILACDVLNQRVTIAQSPADRVTRHRARRSNKECSMSHMREEITVKQYGWIVETTDAGTCYVPDCVAPVPEWFRQIKREAGINGAITSANYDAFLVAAGAHGYAVEIIGG